MHVTFWRGCHYQIIQPFERYEVMTKRTSGRVDWTLFLVIILAAGGFSAFLPGRPGTTAIILSTTVMAIFVLRELNRAAAILFSKPLIFFLGAWSIGAGALSTRPLIAISLTGVIMIMIVYGCLRQQTSQQTIETFAIATTVSLAPSLLGLVRPIVPVLDSVGSVGGYAGYFPWNSSAGLCAAAALVCIGISGFRTRFAWWHLPAAASALIILSASKSATAPLAIAAAMAILFLQLALRRIGAKLRPLAFVAAGIAGFILAPKVFDFLSGFAGIARIASRTESLSGRTQVWEWALQGISESPIWGYGSGFWLTIGEWNNSSHNGFIDLALNAGVPAALATAAILAMAGTRLASTSSMMLPLLTFGITSNLVVSQLTVPAVPALAVWVAVGIAYQTSSTAAKPKDDTVVSAGRPLRGNKIPETAREHTHLIATNTFSPRTNP